MEGKIVIRNEKIYIHCTLNKKRIRFSTKLPNTKENREYVSKNYQRLISFHLSNTKNIKNKHDNYSLNAFLNKIYKSKNTLKPSSQKYYSYAYGKISQFLGKKPLATITRDDIDNFYTYLIKEGLGKVTIQNIIYALKEIFKIALAEDKVSKNVVFSKKLTNLEDSKEITPFNLEEVKYLIATAKKEYPIYFANYLQIAFFSGMRIGEIVALKWDCIDFKNNSILVEKTGSYLGLGLPKTKSSKRNVDMLPPVKEILEIMLASKNGVFIFEENFGRFRAKIMTYWKNLLQICGFEHRKLYITRHTYASIMLNEGEEPLWVSTQLGHKNLSITYNIYTRFIKNKKKPRALFLNPRKRKIQKFYPMSNNFEEVAEKIKQYIIEALEAYLRDSKEYCLCYQN